jgi:hypothetical protein
METIYSWNVICVAISFKDAFTSSLSKAKIESLVSTLKSEGYDTLFHGAANGSHGFLI